MRYFKKYAEEMTAEEKADQKYAIAKSYEERGHPRKAKEYKDKAGKAYKRAYEKTAAEAFFAFMQKEDPKSKKPKRVLVTDKDFKGFSKLLSNTMKAGYTPSDRNPKTGVGIITHYKNDKDKRSYDEIFKSLMESRNKK